MIAAIVHSPMSDDVHLMLSSQYAKALMQRLQQKRINYREFQELDDHWLEIRKALSSGLLKNCVIAFYLHGNLEEEESNGCIGCEESSAGDNVCSCTIGERPFPCISLKSIALLSGFHVFGATACHLGAVFGPMCVDRTGKSFVGYKELYEHYVILDPQMKNPFQEIATQGILDTIDGVSAFEVRRRMAQKYREWANKTWPPGEEPYDWWIIQICLDDNANGVVASSSP